MKKLLFVPLAVFLGLAAFLFVGLFKDPNGELPSALMNKPAPRFELPQLQNPTEKFSSDQMRGKVWILNVWASWCEPCREEHPWLVEYSKTKLVPIVGINWKDNRTAALRMLGEGGDPFLFTVSDADGRVAINYGVTGAPETYVIDRAGVIRYKKALPITKEVWDNEIVPVVTKLNQ